MPASSPRELEAALSQVVAGLGTAGESREGQLEMAEAVAEAFASSRHLVVRAGTGTGKSLGYLVPAVLSKKRVLVATATLALQDQLARKDLPLVERGLRRKVEFAVVKGRVNYLCRQRLHESERVGDQGEFGAPSERSRVSEQAAAVIEWSKKTTSGDRAELDFEPDERVWSSFSVRADECPGAHRCPSGGECFAEAARDAGEKAEVVITNLHLLGAHLKSGRAVLPEFEALVVDEAHELEEVLSRTLGTTIAAGRIRAVAATARAALTDARADGAFRELADATNALETALTPLAGRRLGAELEPALAGAAARCAERLRRLEELCASADGTDTARLRAQLALANLREQLSGLATLASDTVAWVESGPRPSLELAPLDLAPACATLLEDTPVVFTSATVAPDLPARLGADPESFTALEIASPFPYEEHALLYCAAHLPDRRSDASEEAMADELVELITAAGGRTLALFTARRVMERLAEAVAARVAFPILVQDRQPKNVLLAQFTHDEQACLFATMGFWQGIDVPGRTLSLVVIDRLPFPRPDEPLAAARREAAGANGFRTVDLPRARSLLAQGAGRLIRSATDTGVVAVLDPRLATASYRWELVRSLPPMRRTRERAEAVAFLTAMRERVDQ